MRTAIDGAGRVVVPKALRDALGLGPGQALEVNLRDGKLEIEVPPTPVRLKAGRNGPVAVPDRPVPTLTADLVRQTLEQVRR